MDLLRAKGKVYSIPTYVYTLYKCTYSYHFDYCFRAKKVYTGGLFFYSLGMALMALTKSPAGVIIFSWAAGVMYSTLFTMPYLLVARYHATGIVSIVPIEMHTNNTPRKIISLGHVGPLKDALQQ